MTSIAAALKSEVSRLARKQSRADMEGLKKMVSVQRTEIAALKRRVQEMEKILKALAKRQAGQTPAKPKQEEQADEASSHRRFSAKGFANNRKRLGLSAAQFALLIGTTQQSIFAWERGKTQPRAKFISAIAELRGIGKREVAERLAKLGEGLTPQSGS